MNSANRSACPLVVADHGGWNARGSGKLAVRAVLTAEGTDLEHIVEGEIDLG